MDESRIQIELNFDLAEARLRLARRLFFTESKSLDATIRSHLSSSVSILEQIMDLLDSSEKDSSEVSLDE